MIVLQRILWRLWKQKVENCCGARIHAREGALFRLLDVRWTPSFFLLGFWARFLVILALELYCYEAVCLTQITDLGLMKSTNFVRLLIASSSKGWKNRAMSAKKTPTFFGKSPTFFQKRGRFSSIARTFLRRCCNTRFYSSSLGAFI